MKRFWLGCVVGAVLLTGCNEPEKSEAQGMQMRATQPSMDQITYGLLGPGPANYHGMDKLPTYRHRGQENTTGTSFRTMDANRQTMGDDQVTLRGVVEDSPFQPGMVIIMGSHAWINLTVPEDMDEDEKKKEMKALRQEFKRQIPRYQIHINENDQNS
ncbi:hypothetical protein [Halalkalibacter urbisdiaboli]|uniref:hypothetical protein n=1 Tax=Halalkalibacter urbisdiaboli TaxID=1960589 RepID=UPI000B430534|nr:hypothetical protein [Halalkalibacter urbisdiaboli]